MRGPAKSTRSRFPQKAPLEPLTSRRYCWCWFILLFRFCEVGFRQFWSFRLLWIVLELGLGLGLVPVFGFEVCFDVDVLLRIKLYSVDMFLFVILTLERGFNLVNWVMLNFNPLWLGVNELFDLLKVLRLSNRFQNYEDSKLILKNTSRSIQVSKFN